MPTLYYLAAASVFSLRRADRADQQCQSVSASSMVSAGFLTPTSQLPILCCKRTQLRGVRRQTGMVCLQHSKRILMTALTNQVWTPQQLLPLNHHHLGSSLF
ncbi:uncharacterized protein LOC144115294 isoform X1 [Amblyomma americanum]